jgi:ribonuclease R
LGDADESVAAAVLIVNPGGFAFARRLDGEGTVFIPPGRMGDALDGDEVDVRHRPGDKGPEGTVLRVRQRRRTRVVGILAKAGNRRWVLEPDDPRLLRTVIALGGPKGTAFGKVVAARIVDYPSKERESVRVEVERELGDAGTLDVEVQKILIDNAIDETFPADVEAEAERTPSAVREADLENRADLRALPFMTIDPPDARDFDDAVCVEALGEDPEACDMRLHVAVADVSHYVREGTAIDREARHRCFSAYLPDRAVPMLPEQLSAHICSLVPNEDRLAMVAAMTVGPAGEVKNVRLMAGVIHSQRRLSYDEVAGELVGERRFGQPEDVRARIFQLRAVADRLRAARLRRGAIELNLPETKVVLDDDDRSRIRDVVQSRATREMTRAYNLIEELMLAANEAVGLLAVSRQLPIVFRVHDKPDAEKLAQLSTAALSLGMQLDPEKLQKPRGVQKFLSKIAGRERAEALNMLMLRAMAQAEYSTENVGHFALASTAYSHFTSPIRRYPDLITHRVLKAWLSQRGWDCGPEPVPRMPKLRETTDDSARGSARERVVMQAERDAKSLFAALYMQDRVGDRLEGRITGISQGGVFVMLDAPFVDGMIKMASFERALGESYERDDAGVSLVRQIDFALVALARA